MGHLEETLKIHTEELVELGSDLSLKPNDSPTITPKFKPRFSYDLLYFKKDKEICFSSDSWDIADFMIYIETMKKVSQFSMNDLMEGKSKTGIDFKIYPSLNTKLKNIFFEQMDVQRRVESFPSFGRIGLYNSNDGSGKAPRIFFAVGHQATLHILVCDPEHKIYGK